MKGLWRGRSCSCFGLSGAQGLQFYLFSQPYKWRWASSLIKTILSWRDSNIISANLSRCYNHKHLMLFSQNLKLTRCRCNIRRSERSEIPSAAAQLDDEDFFEWHLLLVNIFRCSNCLNTTWKFFIRSKYCQSKVFYPPQYSVANRHTSISANIKTTTRQLLCCHY